MKTITMFETSWCPYCKQARALIDELKSEYPEYRNVQVNIVDEEEHPEISKQYEYYYVPTIYLDKEKLHEGVPTKEIYKDLFDKTVNS